MELHAPLSIGFNAFLVYMYAQTVHVQQVVYRHDSICMWLSNYVLFIVRLVFTIYSKLLVSNIITDVLLVT